MLAAPWLSAALVLLNLQAVPFADVPEGAERTEPTAITIVDGKFTYVGTDGKQARRAGGAGALVVDLGGRTVLPGFNDAHMHLGMQVTLGGAGSVEITEPDRASYLAALRRAAAAVAGDWLFVRSRHVPERLTVQDLNKLDKAIVIASAHGGILNERAQQLGGFSDAECDHGFVRGRLLAAALERIAQRLPPAVLRAEADRLLDGLRRAGITSAQLIDDLPGVFEELLRTDALTARVRMIPLGYRFDNRFYRPQFRSPDPERLQISGVKYFHDDGARLPRFELAELLRLTALDQQQLVVHVLSNRAVESFLDQLEPAAKKSQGLGRLVRFEHVDEVTPRSAARLAAQGVIVCQNPAMLPEWSRRDAFPMRTLKQAGVVLCIGSDWVGQHTPERPYEPFFAVARAVDREAESLPLYDVLQAFTVGSAAAEGMAGKKGAIAVGQLGDLVVLSEDPFRLPDRELGRVRAVMTVVGGRIVYRTPGVGAAQPTVGTPDPPSIGPAPPPPKATPKKQR